jgi:hypothetical protein
VPPVLKALWSRTVITSRARAVNEGRPRIAMSGRLWVPRTHRTALEGRPYAAFLPTDRPAICQEIALFGLDQRRLPVMGVITIWMPPMWFLERKSRSFLRLSTNPD